MAALAALIVALSIAAAPVGRVEAQPPTVVHPDPVAALRGTVHDRVTGQPLAGVRVELEGSRISTTTGSDGRFELGSLPAGPLTLQLRRVGYTPLSVSVVAGDGEWLELVMERAPTTLADVVITPGHFGVMGEGPVATSRTLTREQIAASPQMGEDVFRLVSRLPGVASSDFSAAFRVRGGANDELLVMLDGLPLVEPYHLKDFDGALSIVDAGAVGSVALSAGGFGAEYGDRLTGVLDVRTRESEPGPARTELALTLTALRGTSRGSFDDDRGSWLLSARLGFLDYALRLAGESRDDFHPRYGDLYGKVTWRPAPEHRLSLHFLRADDRLRYQGDPSEALLVSSYESGYVWGSWRAQLDDRLEATTLVSLGRLRWNRQGDRFSSFLALPDLAIRDHRSYRVATFRQDWSWAPLEQFVVSWGAEARRGAATYDYYRMERYPLEERGRLVIRRDTLALAPTPDASEMGAYISQRVRPWSALTVEGGIRLDRQGQTGEREWSPRVSAALRAGPSTTLRAAWGRYSQAQGLYELQAQDGVSDFGAAERAEQRVVGVEQRLGWATARLEAYDRLQRVVRPRWSGVDHELELFPEVGPDRRLISPTSARARGVELLLERAVPSPGARLIWSANYALASSEEEVDGRAVPRPLDQRHTAGLEVGYRLGERWQVSGAWVYHTGWPSTMVEYVVDTIGSLVVLDREFGPRNGERQPAYQRVDLRVTRVFQLGRTRLTAFVDVFNVLDRRLEVRWRPPPPFETVTSRDRFDQWLPRVPSFGVTWEF